MPTDLHVMLIRDGAPVVFLCHDDCCYYGQYVCSCSRQRFEREIVMPGKICPLYTPVGIGGYK